ncbi:MAG: hypothetical protein CMH22_01855 [Methylophaga sp.]|uniref:DUF2254 domain-containing protein n=1 Tax=Methylophaga sp. UBA678 TaxID=1946901 RepID=UPI000C581C53|nr:DUF2254 domain-containing protein [Methylophaga sp. UBA678]MAX50709.1 hypothetical protein [Methylophaga sp.]|tara:strand:- start:83 stop:1348 length:1266 start_codon:yes stop_codon:yes gene_type:complete
MISKWRWLLTQLTRTLWLRASLFAVLAIVTALIAIPVQSLIESPLPFEIGSEAVRGILNILASSMLAVTTFSLSVMVSAYTAASSSATPRATQLVRQDSTTQNVLATFIGSFLYSLVGIIALSTDVYGENGRLILFTVTIGVIILIVVTILRWIEHLSLLGRLSETTNRVEDALTQAMKQRIDYPCLGAKRLDKENPPKKGKNAVYINKVGYIEHIDLGGLNRCAESNETEICLYIEPGHFVHPGEAVAYYDGKQSDSIDETVIKALSINDLRSFDQDPRFGFTVLAEIASRALSPAVNDPGTAIDILSRAVRVLSLWCDHKKLDDSNDNIAYPYVRMPEVKLDSLFDDIFLPISRDGAGMLEIHLRLQKSLLALKQISPECFAECVEKHSDLAYQRALLALDLDADIERLQKIRNAVRAA